MNEDKNFYAQRGLDSSKYIVTLNGESLRVHYHNPLLLNLLSWEAANRFMLSEVLEKKNNIFHF